MIQKRTPVVVYGPCLQKGGAVRCMERPLISDSLFILSNLFRSKYSIIAALGQGIMLQPGSMLPLCYIEVRSVLFSSGWRIERIHPFIFVVQPVQIQKISNLNFLYRSEIFARYRLRSFEPLLLDFLDIFPQPTFQGFIVLRGFIQVVLL